MHNFALQDRQVLSELAEWIADRRVTPTPLRPSRVDELPPVTQLGIGIHPTWEVLRDRLLPTSFPTDHPRYLAFVGGSPTPAAIIADAALSAASVYGGSELEAGDVVAAERAAIRWMCDTVGYTDAAHGVFVSGGSLANLSALVAARHGWVAPGGAPPDVIVASVSAHSSIRAAAAIMGCRVVTAGMPDRPLGGDELMEVLDSLDDREVVAVVANAGATNSGAVDLLHEVADCCEVLGIWLHVDAAYGGAALLVPGQREVLDGIQRASSVTIDPHKWLFTPYDCAAVLYQNPGIARAAHRQHATYLDVVDDGQDNPADYAAHLTRRARGLPLWASLVANGTDAYADAVEVCLAVADYAAKQIDAASHLELATDPHLSVVLFRRHGWGSEHYARWSEQMKERGLALVTPTTFEGDPVLRFCFVNPLTTTEDVDFVLRSLAHEELDSVEDSVELAQPVEPDPVEPEPADPDLIDPDLIDPDLIDPDLIDPELIDPDLIDPEPGAPEPTGDPKRTCQAQPLLRSEPSVAESVVPRKRNARPRIPSWDEIMFGGSDE